MLMEQMIVGEGGGGLEPQFVMTNNMISTLLLGWKKEKHMEPGTKQKYASDQDGKTTFLAVIESLQSPGGQGTQTDCDL